MKVASFILVSLLFVAQSRADCVEGARVNEGIYWYQCNDGVLQLQGCLNGTKQMHVGDSYIIGNAEISCLMKDGTMQFVQTACMYKGLRVPPNGMVDGSNTWFVCAEEGSAIYLHFKSAGCLFKGERVKFGDNVRTNATLYECRSTNTTSSSLVVVGCVPNGQKDLELGEEFQDATTLYACDTVNSSAVSRVIGCVYDGRQYRDYQTYHKGNAIVRCMVNHDRTAAIHTVCGCVERLGNNQPPIEKQIGCFWDQEDQTKPGDAYYMTCKNNTQGAAYSERVRCLYKDFDGNRMEIEPGCFRHIGKSSRDAVGCVQGGEKGMHIQTFSIDRLDIALNYRLRFC